MNIDETLRQIDEMFGPHRYWLRGPEQEKWAEVSLEQFQRAESAAGFYNKAGGSTATGGFGSSQGVSGMITDLGLDANDPRRTEKLHALLPASDVNRSDLSHEVLVDAARHLVEIRAHKLPRCIRYAIALLLLDSSRETDAEEIVNEAIRLGWRISGRKRQGVIRALQAGIQHPSEILIAKEIPWGL